MRRHKSTKVTLRVALKNKRSTSRVITLRR